jgi:glycosyl-4,4'-diaponeurosporenoate acyltransferase
VKLWLVWLANVAGWPIVQLGLGGYMLRLSRDRFRHDSWLTRERRWERGGAIYRWTGVQSWKRFLPDGAAWMGDSGDHRLAIRSRSDCARFAAETRRAETAHWCMLLCTPVFFLWNPPWACAVMAAYAFLTNVPCIVAQRANRLRVGRTEERLRERAG